MREADSHETYDELVFGRNSGGVPIENTIVRSVD